MKKIKVILTGLQGLADGRNVLVVRKTTDYPAEAVVLNAGQIQRLCQRTLGFAGPAAVVALKQAIAVSNGSASLSFDQEVCKAGEAWKNEVTGETGIYGTNNGNKDWNRSSNHEIELGLAANMKIFEQSLNIGLMNATQPVAVVTPAPKKELGIAADPQV